MTRNQICNALSFCVVLLLLIAFAFITVNGLFVSCDVEIFYSPDNNEHVIFLADNPLLLILLVLLSFLLLWLLLRCNITERWARVCSAVMLLTTTLLSLWWITQAKAVPYADSKTVLDAVLEMAAGNTTALMETDYFIKYPYQLGFAFYAEWMAKAFGADALYTTLAIGNVLFLDAIYLSLLAITRRLFRDCRVTLVVSILLLLCWQPAFLCTFLYGLYPGLALALWGSYCTIRFLQEEKPWQALLAALLIGLAILLKQNHKILLVANVLALLVHMLRKKKLAILLGVACMLLAAMLLPSLVQKRYEKKCGGAFGKGTPFTAWLVTGLSESSFCSGWFNSYPITIMPDNGYDPAAAAAQIRVDALERITMFASRPRYLAAFMYHKLTSHWNEPSFQCIWSSAAGEHSGALSPIAESISYGRANRALAEYFNVYDQIVYTGFLIALLSLLRKKERRTDDKLPLLLTILGIFLYHALFEAKAQYALPPFLMMLPYAAYGMVAMADSVPRKRKKPE